MTYKMPYKITDKMPHKIPDKISGTQKTITQMPHISEKPQILTASLDDFKSPRARVFFGAALVDVKTLQRSIAKLGLLSPIVVTEQGGKLCVIDGQKRLSALKRLRFMGQLPRPLSRIPYVLYNPSESGQSPTPALLSNRELYDGVVGAFRKGAKPTSIAKRLYLSRQDVAEIIGLARLAPRLRAYFFDGHIDLPQAKAFAAIPSRERQLCVFDTLGPFAKAEEILIAAKAPLQPAAALKLAA